MSRTRLTLVLVLLALIAAGSLADYPAESAKGTPEGPFPGQKAPDFVLFDLEGKSVRLSDFRGTYVFLNFWATWCPYCVRELPYLNELHEETKAASENIVFLTVDWGEKYSTVRKFMDEYRYTFPVLLDEKGTVSRKYYVSGIPQSFLIDPNGIVVQKYPGMLTEAQMRSVVESVIE